MFINLLLSDGLWVFISLFALPYMFENVHNKVEKKKRNKMKTQSQSISLSYSKSSTGFIQHQS